MNEMLLKNLVIGYSSQVPISKPIQLVLQSGELTAFIGKNGIGKSTLLKTISGILPPQSGTISINGKETNKLSITELSQLMSLVSTTNDTLTQFNVEESISLGRYPYTNRLGSLSPSDRQIIDETIDLLQLKPLKHRKVSELSDGEKQRFSVARALVQETPFMLLDEPTSHLDYPSRIELFQLLQRIAHQKGIGILLSTHELDLCQRFCDRIWCYYTDGKVLSYHSSEINDKLLNRVFNTDIF